MKFKKAISALAALAISASCFAGFAVTASAEAPTAATLVHTGSITSGAKMNSGTNAIGVDQKTEDYNTIGTNTDYGQVAYLEFAFDSSFDTAGVTLLTLTFKATGLSRDRDLLKLYYMPSDFPSLGDSENFKLDNAVELSKKGTECYKWTSSPKNETTYTAEISDASVISALLANKTKIIFGVTDRSNGGAVIGKGTENNGISLTATKAATYNVTYTVGTAAPTSELVVEGSSPKSVPTVNNYTDTAAKKEYTFTGWSDGTNTYTKEQLEALSVTGDMNLTAVFSESAWDEDSLYQNTVAPIGLNNNRSDTYAIGADVGDLFTIDADIDIQRVGDNTSQCTVLFTNESSQTVGGLFVTGSSANNQNDYTPAFYFVTSGSTGKDANSITLETIGEGNYAEMVANDAANPGKMSLRFVVNQKTEIVTLIWGEKKFNLPLNNKATKIGSITYGGYRYNGGSISNIKIKPAVEAVDPIGFAAGNLSAEQIAALKSVGGEAAENTGLVAADDTQIYTIKIAGWDGETLPVIVIDEDTSLTPTASANLGTGVKYGYDDGDKHVFVIQTIGYPKAAKITYGGKDYAMPAAE